MKRICILFCLNKSKTNRRGLSPLYVRISRNSIRTNFATPYSIPQESWDKKGQKIRSKYESLDEVNSFFDLTMAKLSKFRNNSITLTKGSAFFELLIIIPAIFLTGNLYYGGV